MIVRVLRGRVPADRAQAFHRHARDAVAYVLGREGIVCAHLARQHASGGELVIFTTVWRDFDSIYAWLGGRNLLLSPITGPADDPLLTDVDIQHYEDVGSIPAIDPDEARIFLTTT